MSGKLKKVVDESRETNNPEIDLGDRGIVNIVDVPGLMELQHLTRLTLCHNKLTTLPASIASFLTLEILNLFNNCIVFSALPASIANFLTLEILNLFNNCIVFSALPASIANFLTLEILNLFNNCIEELPTTLSSMPRLRILNVGMNKLYQLPRGFGACPQLEVLDCTYNNLSEKSLPANFFCLDTLRAMYMGDNDFEMIPPEIGQLKNLQILCFRENDLVALPKEVGELVRLRELHIQGNRLTVLPPELGNLDLVGTKQVFKAENNPWVTPIADQFQVGISHVFDYIRSDTYKFLYGRHMSANAPLPPKTNDKSKKISRIKK